MFSFKSRVQSIKKVSRINTKKFQKGNLSQHTIKNKILNFNMKIYIYIYRFHQNVQYVVSTLKRKQVSPMVINDWLNFCLLILCQCRGQIDKTDNWGKHTVTFFFVFFVFAVSKRIKNSVACVAKHLVADPNLELRGGGGLGFCRLPCRLFLRLRFFFFFTQSKGRGGGPHGPLPEIRH